MERFCKAINREDLFDHPDYAQNINRVENRSKLVPLLQEELLKKPVPDWVQQLEEGGVPCGPINELSDVSPILRSSSEICLWKYPIQPWVK